MLPNCHSADSPLRMTVWGTLCELLRLHRYYRSIYKRCALSCLCFCHLHTVHHQFLFPVPNGTCPIWIFALFLKGQLRQNTCYNTSMSVPLLIFVTFLGQLKACGATDMMDITVILRKLFSNIYVFRSDPIGRQILSSFLLMTYFGTS